ncbi:MAG TPA: hypothetical protein PLS53_14620 [Thermoanaerobaculaceae bacterium]|nr:hypothetical protein [Thermoanaerobaculaceae bacterium]
MKRWLVAAVVLGLAASGHAAVFERYLSVDRPEDRAIMVYQALERSGKATSMDLTEMAVLLVNKGFPNDARDYLKAALKKDKHNFEAAYRMGLVLQREGEFLKACHWYRRTLKERPGHGPARFMLALAQERAGRRHSAITNYKRAYRHAPDLADPAKNPLVLDSDLQTEALIDSYREKVGRSTQHVFPVDAAAVQRMMLAVPPPVAGQPAKAAAGKSLGGKAEAATPAARPAPPVAPAKAVPAPRVKPPGVPPTAVPPEATKPPGAAGQPPVAVEVKPS